MGLIYIAYDIALLSCINDIVYDVLHLISLSYIYIYIIYQIYSIAYGYKSARASLWHVAMLCAFRPSFPTLISALAPVIPSPVPKMRFHRLHIATFTHSGPTVMFIDYGM